MKKISTLTALASVLAAVVVTPASAQQKIEVSVGAGYDMKGYNRGPSKGYVNWCTVDNKGKIMVDTKSSTCKSDGKGGLTGCPGMCVGPDGQRIAENFGNQ